LNTERYLEKATDYYTLIIIDYYNVVTGVLDNIHFYRLLNGKIFVDTIEGIDIDLLNVFGEIDIEKTERDEESINLKTGKEYWFNMATERGLMVRTRRKTRK